MRLCGRQNEEGTREPTVERGESSSMLSVYQHHIPRASAIRGQPASPPIPGILKARIKHEQWCHFVPRNSIVQHTFCPLGTYWKVTSWKWEGAGDHMRAVAFSWTIKSNWYRVATCWSTPLFFFLIKGVECRNIMWMCCIGFTNLRADNGSSQYPSCNEDSLRRRWKSMITSIVSVCLILVFLQAKAQNKCSKFHFVA